MRGKLKKTFLLFHPLESKIRNTKTPKTINMKIKIHKKGPNYKQNCFISLFCVSSHIYYNRTIPNWFFDFYIFSSKIFQESRGVSAIRRGSKMCHRIGKQNIYKCKSIKHQDDILFTF